MFCPRCGSTQGDDLKFCKGCGANLFAVRQVVDSKEPPEKFDWSKTWLAEMFMSHQEVARRQEEMERRRGITPAVKRFQEIKAGVITSSVGVGVAILLGVLMEGIILGGKVTPDAAAILSRLWVAGVIPFVVGAALIINGLFVSKRLVELTNRQQPELKEGEQEPQQLRAGDTNEFIRSPFSVTEGTTKHLGSSKEN
ncbi:MAG: hypothetical protein C5B55_05355 [Blastocatellia bacterium]|nr:MAG: hypothetical protein C5B55_05355 [Blastocatellia bacterium]